MGEIRSTAATDHQGSGVTHAVDPEQSNPPLSRQRPPVFQCTYYSSEPWAVYHFIICHSKSCQRLYKTSLERSVSNGQQAKGGNPDVHQPKLAQARLAVLFLTWKMTLSADAVCSPYHKEYHKEHLTASSLNAHHMYTVRTMGLQYLAKQ